MKSIYSCYYSFNQCLILKANIIFKHKQKILNIVEAEDLKRAPISQVAAILTPATKIIINKHQPLRTTINADWRVCELDLDLENSTQYDDLIASLTIEDKLIDATGGAYEKQYKKNSLILLLQGSIEELARITFLESFAFEKYY